MTDITYLRTHEGWLYLCPRHCHSDQWRSNGSIIDLFSRRVVGWSAQPRMTTDLALRALLMVMWRRKPDDKVMVHSDQGSQFTSREWQTFLCQHNLEPSMSPLSADCFAITCREMDAETAMTMPSQRVSSSS